MRRVLTYGTFDLFHVGHIRLLERARALGDYLVVGLSTDEFNLGKGKSSVADRIMKAGGSMPKNWRMMSSVKAS